MRAYALPTATGDPGGTGRLQRALALAPTRAAIVATTGAIDAVVGDDLEVAIVLVTPGPSLDAAVRLIRRVSRTRPELRVVAVGDSDADGFSEVLRAGADVWVDQRAELPTLVAAITGHFPSPGGSSEHGRSVRSRPWRLRNRQR